MNRCPDSVDDALRKADRNVRIATALFAIGGVEFGIALIVGLL